MKVCLQRTGSEAGGPDAVFEIRSPNDESYEKLPFYAKLDVREVIIIDRDSKQVEVFSLSAGVYRARPLESGAAVSSVLGILFRTTSDPCPRLVLADAGDPDVRTEI